MNLSFVHIPFRDQRQLEELEHMLQEMDPFVLASFESPGSVYQLKDYLSHHVQGGEPIRALLDRNLLTCVVRAARGETIRRENPVDRIAMAVMAFLRAANVAIEPNLALYEPAAAAGGEKACSELSTLRLAEELHPMTYANLALGDAEEIPEWVLDDARSKAAADEVRSADLEQSLREWKRHRLSLTKIAVLARNDDSAENRLKELFRWSLEDAYFDGMALTLAIGLLSPHSGDGVLKGFRSSDPSRRIAIVENAAWDLTYASCWVEWTKAPDELLIFASVDKNLRELCRVATGIGTIDDLFCRHWPPRKARDLRQVYEEASAQAALSKRHAKERPRDEWLAQLDSMQAQLTGVLTR